MILNPEEITTNVDNLFEASERVIKTNPKKASTIYFRDKRISEIKRAQEELHDRTWSITPMKPFILKERGHTRKIIGNTPYDRMILHSYIDNVLEPSLRKYLICDNYASQVGKGVSFARERFMKYMHQMYRKCNSPKFYVLLIDFSKYYDNVRHDKLYDAIMSKLPYDSFHEYMLKTILNSMVADVSYMSDEEYKHCLDIKYSSLDHIDENRGEKFMAKGLQIGNQASQIFSIFYPTRIDTYIRCVKGIKEHGRYMDDTFVMHKDKEFLMELVSELRPICDDMGIFINEKKTQLYRADKGVKYLNRMYRISENDFISESLHMDTYIRQRRKIKKLVDIMNHKKREYKKPYKEIENQFMSWMGGFHDQMSQKQRDQLYDLYNNLYIKPFLRGIKR